MIQKEQLMIGDWVYSIIDRYDHIEKKVCKIIGIRTDSDTTLIQCDDTDVWHTIDSYEPIPLKRVHLTKNGFECREHTDNTEFFYNDGYQVNVGFDAGLPEKGIPPCIFLNIDFAEKSVCMPIEFVHELQNAMMLSGCDKKIEL